MELVFNEHYEVLGILLNLMKTSGHHKTESILESI
jgi:hypothetical protein